MSTIKIGMGVRQRAVPAHDEYAEATTAAHQRFEARLFGNSHETARDGACFESGRARAMKETNNMPARGIEQIHQGERLIYRLTNGPMMGLLIQAGYEGQGIRLNLYPANGRQSRDLYQLLPRLSHAMKDKRLPVTLSVMPVATDDTDHRVNQRRL